MGAAPVASTSSSHLPGVSSPLATTTLASNEDDDSDDDEDDDGPSDDSDDDEEDEASLRALLQAAKARAKERERDMERSPQRGANLEDVKLDEMDECVWSLDCCRPLRLSRSMGFLVACAEVCCAISSHSPSTGTAACPPSSRDTPTQPPSLPPVPSPLLPSRGSQAQRATQRAKAALPTPKGKTTTTTGPSSQA